MKSSPRARALMHDNPACRELLSTEVTFGGTPLHWAAWNGQAANRWNETPEGMATSRVAARLTRPFD